MNTLKRYLGILWMLAGPLVFIFLIITAVTHIHSAARGDISNPVPWLIIIVIFTPIAIGISIFGWYCWQGVYDRIDQD